MKNRISLHTVICFAVACMPVAGAHCCEQWEYASLSVHEVLMYSSEDKNSVVGVQQHVSWFAKEEAGVWQNDKFLTGSIKRPLTEYFGIKNINNTNILNSVGRKGWEAFSHVILKPSRDETSHEYDLKRCLRTNSHNKASHPTPKGGAAEL